MEKLDFHLLRQVFPERPRVAIEQALSSQLACLASKLDCGAEIGVACGSRGISRIAEITRVTVDVLKAHGFKPFLFPAMGSHGGATEVGQASVLKHYGIEEQTMGAPVRASMDVVPTGETKAGMPVFCSKVAYESDGILLINRIKPHTDFRGEIGSGLMKMSIIGLGKRDGAAAFHRASAHGRYAGMIEAGAAVNLKAAPVLGGIAIVEDESHEVGHLEFVEKEAIPSREKELYLKASEWLPRLPFDEVDLLIVDEIGKDISGTGMDTNITGRTVHGYHANLYNRDEAKPFVKRIFVRGLSQETQGNAIGIGAADFTLKSLVDAIDISSTYMNTLTSNTPQNAKIPMYFDSDKEVLQVALNSLSLPNDTVARIVWIKNTLELQKVMVSKACLEAIREGAVTESLGTFEARLQRPLEWPL